MSVFFHQRVSLTDLPKPSSTSSIQPLVFFTILLVAGNTMAQSFRERTSELAVLKALGYSNGKVVGIVLGESLLLSCFGGGLGLFFGWLFVTFIGDPTGGLLPNFYLPRSDIFFGTGFVILLGLATGILPALQATRIEIATALRKA